MAKAGTPSRTTDRGSNRSESTRSSLIEAALWALKEHGYGGASARAIAERAGVNQGLVFYHFGSVVNLLLAALDNVSDERLRIYGSATSASTSPSKLVDFAEGIFRNDLEAGYITVLAEMIAGASSTPGLGPEVAARIEPWRDFARAAIETSLGESPLAGVLPASEVAHAIVALYLGLEMLSHLEGDSAPALALFEHAKRFASLLEAMSSPTTMKES